MMRKFSVTSILIAIFAIFILCFMIGKSNAIRQESEEDIVDVETPTDDAANKEEISPASTSSEKIKKEETENQESKIEIEPQNTPPDRMYFPCGQTVLKEYSQQAVYSKTMDDWRAHTGIDYKADIGSDVVSVWDGVVKNTYKDSLWGYVVEIEHDGEITSVYKNLDENIFVKKGVVVSKGQAIGKVGNSASVESRDEAHLHFEIWTSGMPINPDSYIY